MQNKVRVGIIGCAPGICREHIKNLAQIKEAEIVALCDINEDHLQEGAKLSGAEPDLFKDWEKLIKRKDIEAVVISTPNYLHKEMSMAALEEGKHVFLEKPMAPTIEECNEIIKKVEETGLILQVGLEYRYSPIFRQMKKITERELGKVVFLWCKEFRGDWKVLYPEDWEKDRRENWRLKKTLSGGSLVEKNCHHFDIFNWLTESMPLRVAAFGGIDIYRDGRDTLDNVWVIEEFKDGQRASLGLCLFAHTPESRDNLEIGVIGEGGRVEAYVTRGEIWFWSKEGEWETVYVRESTRKKPGHSGAPEEMRAFIQCVREKKRPFADVYVGKMSILPAVAGEKAVEEGRIVYIEEMDDK